MFESLSEALRIIIIGLKHEWSTITIEDGIIKVLAGIYIFFILLISDIIMWVQDKRGIIWFLGRAWDRVIYKESDYGNAEDLSRLVMDYKALFKSLLWANIIIIVFAVIILIWNYFTYYKYMDL